MTKSEDLALLADDPDVRLRERIASHKDTPEAVMLRLAGDEWESVALALIENPSVTPAVLLALSTHRDEGVLEAVADHPSAPPEALLNVVKSERECWWALDHISDRIDAPADALSILAGHRERRFRLGVAHNPSAPAEALDRLAGDDELRIQYAVFRNPATPPEIVARLGQDEQIIIVQRVFDALGREEPMTDEMREVFMVMSPFPQW